MKTENIIIIALLVYLIMKSEKRDKEQSELQQNTPQLSGYKLFKY